jgi:hypothetical protein
MRCSADGSFGGAKKVFPSPTPSLREYNQPSAQPDDFRAWTSSKVGLIWITPKAELHTTKMRIVGLGVQTDVHRCKVNIPPSALDRQ